jgi:hypothetical protein
MQHGFVQCFDFFHAYAARVAARIHICIHNFCEIRDVFFFDTELSSNWNAGIFISSYNFLREWHETVADKFPADCRQFIIHDDDMVTVPAHRAADMEHKPFAKERKGA